MGRVGRLSGLNTETAELSKQLVYSSGPLSNRTGGEGALLLALTAQSWSGWSLFLRMAAALSVRLRV